MPRSGLAWSESQSKKKKKEKPKNSTAIDNVVVSVVFLSYFINTFLGRKVVYKW